MFSGVRLGVPNRGEGFHYGSHQRAIDRVRVCRRRRHGRKNARVRLGSNSSGPVGTVAAIAPCRRSRHAGLRLSDARLLGTNLAVALRRDPAGFRNHETGILRAAGSIPARWALLYLFFASPALRQRHHDPPVSQRECVRPSFARFVRTVIGSAWPLPVTIGGYAAPWRTQRGSSLTLPSPGRKRSPLQSGRPSHSMV